MKKSICPNCKKKELRQWKFDLGYGIEVQSMHCLDCKFNITAPKRLEKAMRQLEEKLVKNVKVVNIGEGLGIRFPKELSVYYKIKKGKNVLVKPEKNVIKLFL